ncbi:glucosamine inositolphosphorylceramide transferase family protein [Halocatena marina]|uniref:glucosamine inositolphosphorylceramide transferase family protein n=1 Tax=Halocatena marina TaxID=2934937 RepID=UPI002223FDD8|nr:hypothetical protein [Halocatena marina]
MDWTRRHFLYSAVGIAGLSGCLQNDSGSSPPSETVSRSPIGPHSPVPTAHSQTNSVNEKQSNRSTDPSEETSQTDDGKAVGNSLYQGETIPGSPHAPSGTAPPIGLNFDASIATPVLRASDVTDYGEVDYVADPFLFVEDGTWHMFFEIFNEDRTPDAPIGHATSSDGLNWTYDQIAIKKEVHTSFPLVWKYKGEYYMCPPSGKRVELYKARSFPNNWKHVGNAIDVEYYSHDPTFIRYQNRWWLFTERDNRDVMIYHSRDLESEGWTPHKANPVVTDRLSAGRQGGRPICSGDRLFLYFQDSVENYGDRIRCYEVTDLSPSTYNDREMPTSPLLHEFGDGWAGDGMHTFDPWWLGPGKGWRCAVDGVREQHSVEDLFTIGIVDLPAHSSSAQPSTSTLPEGVE